MATGTETKFETTGPLQVPTNALTAVTLHRSPGGSDHVDSKGDGILFRTEGWYEILMAVQWNPDDIEGTRFSHTKIPGQEPLHSEAINAAVLAQISEGRQMLRADTLFGLDRTTSLILEVWQDSGESVEVRSAEIVVRELRVPWAST